MKLVTLRKAFSGNKSDTVSVLNDTVSKGRKQATRPGPEFSGGG